MTNETLLLTAIGLVAISGLPGLVPTAVGGARSQALHRVSVGILTCGVAVGLFAAARVLSGVAGMPLQGSWALPGAELALELDTLSAFFVIPILLIAASGAWFGLEYRNLKPCLALATVATGISMLRFVSALTIS